MLLPFTYSHTKPQSERAYFTAIKCIGPFTDQNDNFPSLPYPTLVKSQQFHVHQAVKRVTLFWAEPPVWGIIGRPPLPTHTPSLLPDAIASVIRCYKVAKETESN